jgi:hypothetical protein
MIGTIYWVGPDQRRSTIRPDRPVFIDAQWWDGDKIIIEYHPFEYDF